jgi:predicted nucleic acid-binding protein
MDCTLPPMTSPYTPQPTKTDWEAALTFMREWLRDDEAWGVPPFVLQAFARHAQQAREEEREALRKTHLPELPNELYEFYPSMSPQTHEAAVKEYARNLSLKDQIND